MKVRVYLGKFSMDGIHKEITEEIEKDRKRLFKEISKDKKWIIGFGFVL